MLREASTGAKRNLADFFFCSFSHSFGPEMPNDNAEARGGWRKEGRSGVMIDESKTTAFRREIVLISGDERWGN